MSAVIVNPGAETVAPPSPVISPAQENDGSNEVAIEDALAHLAHWDISNDELKKFTDENGIYSTIVRNLSDLKVEDILTAKSLVLNSNRYLVPERERILGRSRLSNDEAEIDRLVEEYKRRSNYKAMLDFAEKHADDAFFKALFEDSPSWTDADSAKRDAVRKLDYLIRDIYNGKVLPRLLAKLRELLAFSEANPKKHVPVFDSDSEDSGSDSEGKPKDEPKVVSEETKVVGRSPFGHSGDLDETIRGLIQCVHLFLIHVRSDEYRFWKLNLESEEGSSETKDEKKELSDWDILGRFLKQDVEKNGPAPEKLQFFYKSADVALRLEGFSGEQLSALEQSNDEKVAETLACIKEAREYFGIR